MQMDADNMVYMPLWYWLQIADYIIDTQELQISLQEGENYGSK